eukprot:3586095-Amphidinium_carterae.1
MPEEPILESGCKQKGLRAVVMNFQVRAHVPKSGDSESAHLVATFRSGGDLCARIALPILRMIRLLVTPYPSFVPLPSIP